jgi:hypothetical protein
MKKETEQKENKIFKNIETIETTPNDGVVSEKVIRPIDMNTIGKYHKGYTKTKVYSTNDPRITRPFIYGMCGLFFGIGLLTLLIGLWYFAIPFISISIFAFIKSKKDIDKIAEELKTKGHDVTIDSVEEKEQLKEEIVGSFKDSFKDVTSNTFTKDKFKWFVKTTIPIYCIITIVITLLLGILINIILGILVFIILSICGLLYYFILSKIFKN